MARIQKNAAGEDVPVDTPEFGCITIAPEPAPKIKAKPVADAPATDTEGE